MALIQCRITAKFLVQNKKQISAKKDENLQKYDLFSKQTHILMRLIT